MKKIFLVLIALGLSSNSFAYHVSGTIYCDANLNGILDAGDTRLSGVIVQASKDAFAPTDTTGTDGTYYIDMGQDPNIGLEASIGTWTITIINGLSAEATVHAPENMMWMVTFTPGSGDNQVLQLEGADFAIDDPACREPEPFCGDGNVDTNEICDDGNNLDGDGCSAVCTVEAMCGDGNLDPGEQCDDGNDFNGDGCSAMCNFEAGGEGCTPGYWKQRHHFDSYPAAYAPDTMFGSVFEDAFPGKTLVQVAKTGGGGLKALGRHTVAALLNAGSENVEYDRSVMQVIDSFNAAYASGSYNFTKNMFESFNEQGCPLN
jgi:cysteine-rich repeat protein